MINRPETTLKIRVSFAMMHTLEEQAAKSDVSVGQLVRDALQVWMARGETQHTEASFDELDEKVLKRCRKAVRQAHSHSTNWKSMQGKLVAKGYEYRPLGGGLAIFEVTTGRYICKASAVGPGYSELIRRFQAPFPGHPHRKLAARVLKGKR